MTSHLPKAVTSHRTPKLSGYGVSRAGETHGSTDEYAFGVIIRASSILGKEPRAGKGKWARVFGMGKYGCGDRFPLWLHARWFAAFPRGRRAAKEASCRRSPRCPWASCHGADAPAPKEPATFGLLLVSGCGVIGSVPITIHQAQDGQRAVGAACKQSTGTPLAWWTVSERKTRYVS